MNSYCMNPECGEEFAPTESSDGQFCSWDCAEAVTAREDAEYDADNAAMKEIL